MPRIVEEIVLKVNADTGGLDEKVDESKESMDGLTKSVGGNKSSLKIWAGVAAAAAGVAGLGLLVKKQSEAIIETDSYANRLGITTQRLMALQVAAGGFNVAAEEVNEGLKNMVERLGEASLEGQGATFDAITKLGLDLKELESLSTEDKFLSIADALSKVENESERTFLQMEIGQEEFFRLSEMMNLGKDGIKDAMKEAQNLTGVLSDLDIQNIRDMGAEAGAVSAAFNSIFTEISASVAPVMSEILSITSDLFVSFREDGLPIVNDWATRITSVFLDFAENVLPSLLTIGSAVFDGLTVAIAAFSELAVSAFSFIGTGWAALGNEVAGDRNWIDDISASIGVAAKAWPELLQNAFLNIASGISSVLSFVEDRFMAVVDEVQEAGLIAANTLNTITFGKSGITDEEMEAGILSIRDEQSTREREGGFFDDLKKSQEFLIGENNKIIQAFADETVNEQERFKSNVADGIGGLRKALTGFKKLDFDKKPRVPSNLRKGNQGAVKDKQVKISKPLSAVETGTSQALDLLASRSVGEDENLKINKEQLTANQKQVTLLEKISKNKNTFNVGSLA